MSIIPAYIIEAEKEARRRYGSLDDPRSEYFIEGFIDGYLTKQQEPTDNQTDKNNKDMSLSKVHPDIIRLVFNPKW